MHRTSEWQETMNPLFKKWNSLSSDTIIKFVIYQCICFKYITQPKDNYPDHANRDINSYQSF